MGFYVVKMVKVTKSTISMAIVENCGISGNKAAKITDSIICELKNALLANSKVKFSGFGSFLITQRAPRKGRNMQTGETIFIPSQQRICFKPSQTLKNKVQKGTIK